jgi:hypothetical protein
MDRNKQWEKACALVDKPRRKVKRKHYSTKQVIQFIQKAIAQQGYIAEWIIIQCPDGSKEMFRTMDYLRKAGFRKAGNEQ